MDPFISISDALDRFRAGGMVILVDDEWRENEGDLAVAAEHITPEAVAFMAVEGRGLICLAMAPQMIDRLALPMQAPENTSRYGTAFTVSVDAREGISTGISAQDRARTIRVAIGEDAKPEDLAKPGHVFPLRAREGGVLVRSGQTEGVVDLCRLAGLNPAGVICEVMKDDGTMARLPDLKKFSAAHDIPIVKIADIIEHRRRTESLVECISTAGLPSRYGRFRLCYYVERLTGVGHTALVKGRLQPGAEGIPEPVLVRVHSECLTGDALGSLRCDCGEQLHTALGLVEKQGEGGVVYMRQEGRGIGLENKMKAYELQDGGLDTVEANHQLGLPADLRDYGIGAQILHDLGVRNMRLMTNNPRKIAGLSGFGLKIAERVPLEVGHAPENLRYLKDKRDKLGHLIERLDP